MDEEGVLRERHISAESPATSVDDGDTLVFVVNALSNRQQIKDAVEQMYSVKVARVNTLVRPDGTKKAFVKLEPRDDSDGPIPMDVD